jgi:hypothetical protein
VENRINRPTKMKIVAAAASGSWKAPSFWQRSFSWYIRTCTEGEAEITPEARTGLGGTVSLVGCTTCARLQFMGPPVTSFFLNSLFFMERSIIFFPKFISGNIYVKKTKRRIC